LMRALVMTSVVLRRIRNCLSIIIIVTYTIFYTILIGCVQRVCPVLLSVRS